jgi:hypothetical protein
MKESRERRLPASLSSAKKDKKESHQTKKPLFQADLLVHFRQAARPALSENLLHFLFAPVRPMT